MTDGGSRVALLSLGNGSDDAEVERVALRVATAPGVVRSAGFVRETPSDQPFAGTFGNRGLVVAELTGDGGCLDAQGTGLVGTALGRFAIINTYSRRDGAMPDFASAAGILVVMLNNLDPNRDDDFNRWYDNIHLGDVTGAAGFWGGIRGRNIADEPGPGSSRYLALYCTDVSDVLVEQAKLRAAVANRELWHAIEQVHNVAYRRVGST